MAATEDRTGIYIHERRSSFYYDLPLETDAVLYEGTLAQLNGSGNLESLSHGAGDNDSNVVPLAVLTQQRENQDVIDPVHRDRGGTDPHGRVFENVVLELKDNTGNLGNYTVLETTVYAVDNETVSNAQADGSSGDRAPVGTVVGKKTNAGTVLVHVDGATT